MTDRRGQEPELAQTDREGTPTSRKGLEPERVRTDREGTPADREGTLSPISMTTDEGSSINPIATTTAAIGSTIEPQSSSQLERTALKRKRDIEQFGAKLNTSLQQMAPRSSKEYQRVAVLGLSWDNDDLDVRVAEKKLLQVFEETYNFTIDTLIMPSTVTTSDLFSTIDKKLSEFRKTCDKKDDLAIFIYSGHGDYDDKWKELKIYGAVKGPEILGQHLTWDIMARYLQDQTDADILYILDTCFAGRAGIGEGPELLAASHWDSDAAGKPDVCFTKTLTDVLKGLDGEPRTVSQIYAALHRGAIDNQIARPPLHVTRESRASIVLQRMEPDRKTKRFKDHHIDALKSAEPRVLVSIHLDHLEPVPTLSSWDEWIRSITPPTVEPVNITIEGVFKSKSSLMLVALPIEVWTHLKWKDTAYKFIEYVRSSNELIPKAERQPIPLRGLMERPHRMGPSGTENIPLSPRAQRGGGNKAERPSSMGSLGRFYSGGLDGSSDAPDFDEDIDEMEL